MRFIYTLILSSVVLYVSTTSTFSDAYSELQDAIFIEQTPIDLPQSPVNWGTKSLTLNYNVTLNNTLGGGTPVNMNGNGSKVTLFFIGTNNTPTNSPTVVWKGPLLFSNVLAEGALSGGLVVGGALSITPAFISEASGNSNVTFNGDVSFQDNQANGTQVSLGAGFVNYGSQVTFNGTTQFTNNSVISPGIAAGAALITSFSQGVTTFNGPSFFINNITQTDGTSARFLGSLGGAVGVAQGGATVNFNAPAIFSGNTVTNNTAGSAGLYANAYGGALSVPGEGVVNLVNPQFTNNQATASDSFAYGGAVFLDNSTVTIHATDPSVPVLFSGNTVSDITGTRQQAIYLSAADLRGVINNPSGTVGPATLILTTDAGTTIDIQDPIASDGGGNTIIKQGLGTWKQGGDSSGYRDTTTIVNGVFQLQPGSIYGTTASGTVTIGPGGTLLFNYMPGNLPLLQGANINLDGLVSVTGPLNSHVNGVVARGGSPIMVNGSSAVPGSILQKGQTLFYNWQLIFSNAMELNLLVQQIQTLADVVKTNMLLLSGGNQNDINVARALDAFDGAANPGQLADYKLAIMNSSTPQEALSLIDPLQGEVLAGGFDFLQTQLQVFNTQIDDRLNMVGNTLLNTTMNRNGRILLASRDNTNLPLSIWSPAPWVGWGQVIGGLGRQNQDNGSNGYDSRSAGLIWGFDRALDQSWRLGAVMNFQRGILDWDKYAAETRSNILAASLYGSYDYRNWFVRSQVGGGGSWVKNRRDIPMTVLGGSLLTASSDTTLPFFDGRVGTGYHFYSGDLRVTPSVGLFYVHMNNNPFSETGAGQFNLRVDRSNQDNLEAQGNFEVAYTPKINDRPVTLRASYGLAFEALDKFNTITTGFLAFPNLISFTASSVSPGRWRQIAEVGMNVEVAKNVRFRLDYLGMFARHHYTQMGAVGLKIVF